jgi:hypothetical protein
MEGTAALNAFDASSLSFLTTAVSMSFILVLALDLKATFLERHRSFCLALFSADLFVANINSLPRLFVCWDCASYMSSRIMSSSK